MALLPAYRLKLYRNFKAIEGTDFHAIVRYYERFEDDIRDLDFEEYFDCTVAYANALFETGAFGKHLVMSDHLLETVIMQNIDSWGNENIYEHLLFKKAASLFRLQEYAKSEHILRELVKLNPWDKNAVNFLKTVLFRQKPLWLPRARSAALMLILVSATLIAAEFFFFKFFFPGWLGIVHQIRVGAMVSGLALLGGGEFWHFWQSFKSAEDFAGCFRKKKS